MNVVQALPATEKNDPPRQETKAVRDRERALRWVVEHSHSWLNRFGQLLVRAEKREDTCLAMRHFAGGWITWRAAQWK